MKSKSKCLKVGTALLLLIVGISLVVCAQSAKAEPVSEAAAMEAKARGRSVKVTDIWVVLKTHLDIGYTETIDEVLKQYRGNMMDKALGVIEQDRQSAPEKRFVWTLAGWPLAHVLGPLQEPARKARIEQAVREGTITAHALPFTYHTETADLEELVRGLGFSSKIARTYGRPLPSGAKMTDVPCHSWVWPTLLSNAGIRFLQIGCNDLSAYVHVPDLFWWEGPDGARILCQYTRVYGSGLKPPRSWPSRNYLAMVMTYDNQGPPSVEEVENLRQKAEKEFPGVRVHFGTLDDFAKAVLAEAPELPVIRADMPDTWIHGWLSMPVEAKTAHNLRPLEPALEGMDTQLRGWGLTPSNLAPALAEAYEQSSLFSEHTFGPDGPNGHSWNSGTPRYLYGNEWQAAYARGAYKKYEQAFDDKRAFARKADEIVRRELASRLDLLAKSVKADCDSVLVYNALPWKRSGRVDVPGKPGHSLYAEDVPANGYRVIAATAKQPEKAVSSAVLDTPFFKVTFDLTRGGITSLVDRKTGRQCVDQASAYALGQFLHERYDRQQMTAFHNAYGRGGHSWLKSGLPTNLVYAALTPPAWASALVKGAAADVVTLTATDALGLAKGLALVYTFPHNQPCLEVEWRVTEKTPDPLPEGGWLCFPLAVDKPQFLLGRLGGPIDPTKDIIPGANRHYFCISTGVTVTDKKGTGFGLCPIDSPCVSLGEPGLWKHSMDYLPKQATVFVNLYNNEWNTNFPEWIGGSWTSRVRLWPMRGGKVAEGLAVHAWEARLPLLSVPVAQNKSGPLPSEQTGLELSRKGVLVTAFGANPDGKGIILRLWEQAGVTGQVTVRLPKSMDVKAVQPVDLRGTPVGEEIKVKKNTFTVELKAFAPLSFVLSKNVAKADLSFPFDMDCVPQPGYRHRADNKPGREITLNFKGEKLYGAARVEVVAGGRTETTKLAAVDGGVSSVRVLLPEGVSVKEDVSVTLTLRQDAKSLMKTLTVPAMRHWTVYLYSHSHVDIGYTAPHKVVELIHKRNIVEGIKLAEATKKYPVGARSRWNPEVTWPLERLWMTMPEEHENVLKAIRTGGLCVDASYVNLNTSVCSDEELFHAFSFSREMQKLTGVPMDTFQQIDIPGMSWGLVPVMAQVGVRYIMAWPNGGGRIGNARVNIEKSPFWWVGPDGKSKVLFFQPGNYGNSGSMSKGGATGRPWFGQRDSDKIPAVIKTGSANVDFMGQLVGAEQSKHPYDFMVLSWCLWDNCPLDADIPDAVKAWNEQYAYPKVIIAGGHEIMSMIETKYGDQLPVVKGDFTEYWTDGLGTAARLTAGNRNAKEKLTQAETLWTMLRPGKPAPRAEFDDAWRNILLGSEHTWCAENPAEPFFQDAIWKVKQSYFREATDRTQTLFDEALAPATDKSNGAGGPATGPANGGIAVFNTHSWIHGGLVTLAQAESSQGDRVTDEQGKDVPAQRLSTGELVFQASSVPAFGSRHYRVVNGKCPITEGCKLNATTMENRQLRVTLDPATGNISQLVELASGHNYADVSINGGLNAFRWIPANRYEPKADTDIAISTVEAGPLVVELRVSSKATGCRSVSRSVRLVAGQPWVEISNIVDKLPLVAKDGIHFGFGFNVPQGKTRVDIPWGVMEVEKDQWPQANRNWLAMQRWLNVSNDKEGVTWCSLDAPLFEYGDMTANIDSGWGNAGPWIKKLAPSSTIYSWAMNNHWITNFPLTQDGPVTFRYRILPHGAYDATVANRFGLEQAQPLAHVAANNDPKIKPLVAVDNPKVCVTILKPTADGKAAIVRLRSLADKQEIVKLSFPAGTPKSVRLCPLEETPGEPVDEHVAMPPYGLVTLCVEFNNLEVK